MEDRSGTIEEKEEEKEKEEGEEEEKEEEEEEEDFFEEEEALNSLAFWDDQLDVVEENKSADRNEGDAEIKDEETRTEKREERREEGGGEGEGEREEEGEGGEGKAMVDFLCSAGIPLSAADLYAFRLFRCHVTTPVLSPFLSFCFRHVMVYPMMCFFL